MNVLRGLLEENLEDIKESVQNLILCDSTN